MMSEPNDLLIKDPSRLARIGLIATVVYFASFLVLGPVLYLIGWIRAEPLALNEVGDFLAGLFGPLAIFWLVLGFFQQGEELRNSVDTLKLQAKELAASVSQQKELVHVTREQLAHEREVLGLQKTERQKLAQPDFIIQFRTIVLFGGGKGKYRLKLVNSGSAVSRVEILILDGERTAVSGTWAYFEKGKEDDTLEAFGRSEVPIIDRILEARVRYVDNLNSSWEVTYDLAPPISDSTSGLFVVTQKNLVQLT